MESIFSRLRRKNGYSQLFNSCWKVLTQTIYLLFCLLFAFPLSTHCSLSLFPPSPLSLPHPLTPSSLPLSFPSFVSHCLIISLSPSSFIPPSLSFTFLCLSPSLLFHPSLYLSHSLPLPPSPILSISSWNSLACFSFYLIKRFYFYFNLFLF